MPLAEPPRSRRKRTWLLILGGALAAAAVAAALPWLASTTPAREWVLGRVNRALAPSRLTVEGYRLSWFGPIRASGVVLRDDEGKTIVSAPRLAIDRGLVAIATERALRLRIAVDGLAMDLVRRPDGTLNLVDALAPYLKSPTPAGPTPPPEREAEKPAPKGNTPDLTLTVSGGSIRFRSPELLKPLIAGKMDLAFHLPAGQGPLSWRVNLANPARDDASTLTVTGEFDHHAQGAVGADLNATMTGQGWPFAISNAGVEAVGRFDGHLIARRGAGRWGLSGDAAVLDLTASGPALAGDQLRLDRVGGQIDVGETAVGWDVRKLDLRAPFASIKAGGTVSTRGKAGSSTRIEGRIDLAGLAGQLPHLLRIREGLAVERGTATLLLEARDGDEADGQALAVDAKVSDLVALDAGRRIAVRDPATLAARVRRRGGEIQVESLTITTPFLDAKGSGDLERGISISAGFDLDGLKKEFRDLIDFGGVELTGKGRLAADYRRAGEQLYAARFAAEVQGLRVAGLTASAIERKQARVDATATGPRGPTGLPLSWSHARIGLHSDDLVADVRVASKPSDPALQLDEVRLVLQVPTLADPARTPDAPGIQPGPQGGAPAAVPTETLRLVVRGRYDREAGRLELKPPLVPSRSELLVVGESGVQVTGLNSETIQAKLDLSGDLARLDRALAAWNGGEVQGLAGSLAIVGNITVGPGGFLDLGGALQSPNLSVPGSATGARREVGPSVLGLHAKRPAGVDRIDIQQLTLATQYGRLDTSGNVVEPAGRRVADLQAAIVLNWPALDPLIAASVEPKARFRGDFRPFHVRGPLVGGLGPLLKGIDSELVLDKFEALAFGLRSTPTSIAIHCGGGQIRIDPIETTINEGATLLRPALLIDDQGALALAFAQGTAIQGVVINDEVSQGLLTYIAPVLQDATKVRGKVSIAVDRAEIPITSQRSMTLVGRVDFNDVVFAAGSFANELVGLTGRGHPAEVRLHQPVALAIADGRVNQRGLSVPIGRNARLEVEGSVGFDQTLAMRARIPMASGLLGQRQGQVQGLDGVLEGLRVGIPIGGTLSHPTIDNKAMRIGLRDVGKSVLKRGAGEFLKELTRPGGNAPQEPPANP